LLKLNSEANENSECVQLTDAITASRVGSKPNLQQDPKSDALQMQQELNDGTPGYAVFVLDLSTGFGAATA
jgi:hypothetical protein